MASLFLVLCVVAGIISSSVASAALAPGNTPVADQHDEFAAAGGSSHCYRLARPVWHLLAGPLVVMAGNKVSVTDSGVAVVELR